MYLTYDEYSNMGKPAITEKDFNELVAIAADTLDFETMAFYRFHDLETDKVVYRKEQFKKAMAYQIAYMQTNGIKTVAELNSPVTSVSLGRTSVSGGNIAGSNADSSARSLMTQDVKMLLYHTGLLYKGVRYTC